MGRIYKQLHDAAWIKNSRMDKKVNNSNDLGKTAGGGFATTTKKGDLFMYMSGPIKDPQIIDVLIDLLSRSP